jgi:hypothetical protein
VTVDRAFGDTGLLGQVPGRGLDHALLDEQLERGSAEAAAGGIGWHSPFLSERE